jgi:hypothetical protein
MKWTTQSRPTRTGFSCFYVTRNGVTSGVDLGGGWSIVARRLPWENVRSFASLSDIQNQTYVRLADVDVSANGIQVLKNVLVAEANSDRNQHDVAISVASLAYWEPSCAVTR